MKLSFLFVTTLWVLVTSLITFSSASSSPCDSFGTCSQKCDLVEGRAQCSCLDGFSLTGNSSCTETDSQWKLIFATKNHIISITYPGKLLTFINTNSDIEANPLFVTTDVRGATVYWTDAQDRRESIYKKSINGTTLEKPEIVVDVGMDHPEGVAFDWITGNLYFVDYKLKLIAVCAQNPTSCTVLFHDMQKPRDITLHPNQGLMFWSDWGTNACIKKSGMDGSSPTAIVTTNLVWPNGLTVDEANSRIYWVDAHDHEIESSRLDGTDRKIIKSSAGHPFDIEIFGDFIFWTDWDAYKIASATKFTGGNETKVYSDYATIGRIDGLSVMHIGKQPILRANPCDNLRCSHICALAGQSGAQCLCPAGMMKTGNTCVEDQTKPKVLVAQKDLLLFMRVDTIGKDVFEHIPLPSQVKDINALVYNPINDTVIISEGYSKKIIEYSLKTLEFTVLIESGIVTVISMDLDVNGENLIWLDVGKGTIEAMSLRTRSVIVVLRDVGNAHDILYAPDRLTLYFSKTGTTGYEEIHKISLGNKSNDSTFYYKITDSTKPAQLTYTKESGTGKVVAAVGTGTFFTIYGQTMATKKLRYMRVAGNYIEDVIKIGNQLFWVDNTSEMKVISEDGEYCIRISFNTTTATNKTNLVGRKMLASINSIDYLDDLRDNHECSPKNLNRKICSHICLPTGINMLGECFCSVGFHLKVDGVTCIKSESNHEDETTVEMTMRVPSTTTIITAGKNTISEHRNNQSATKSVMKDESKSAKVEGSEHGTGSIVAYVILALIIIVMGAIIIFIVIYWRKPRSIPFLTKPYSSNHF